MDMFDNLDNFLSGQTERTLPDSPVTDNNVVDTSLNDSGSDLIQIRKGRKRAASNNLICLDEPKKRFVPAKGQKTAAKRLEKLQDDVKLAAKVTTLDLSLSSQQEVAQILAQQENVAKPKPVAKKRQRNRALQSVQEDVIDLVTSPHIVFPDVVTLDSDEEIAEIRQKSNSAVDSPQFDNNEVQLKVNFGNGIDEFSFRRHQKFSELVKLISDRKSVDANQVLLMFKDELVDLDSTPHKINFLPGMLFSARFMDNLTASSTTAKNDNDIMLKVQSASWKKVREMNINKTEKLQVLLFMCAEEMECDANDIKLKFDGDFIDTSQTAEDYDMEGGEIIDIHKK